MAIDSGKAWNRVWLSTGEGGQLVQACSLPTTRQGVEDRDRLVRAHQGPSAPVLVVEATGGLHQGWVSELERRFPGRVRMVAPSETTAARTQLGSRGFKTDDRDCAALTYLARQGQGRPAAFAGIEALRSGV